MISPDRLFLALSFSLAASVAQAQPAPLERVAVGGHNIIPLSSAVTRLALGNPDVVDVRLVADRQLRLLGLKEGSTNLTVWSAGQPQGHTYNIVVGPSSAALNDKLQSIPALRGVMASTTPQGIALEGEVASLEAQTRAAQLAASEAGGKVQNMVSVSGKRMVAVEVRFAAVSSGTLKALGINFQKMAGGFQFATGAPNTFSQASFTAGGIDFTRSLPISQAFNLLMAWPGSDNYGVALSALGSVNLAQILAEPTLLVRSGDEADFLAGGEIPIPVPQSGQNGGAIGIEYRKFGVRLHVGATVLSNDRLVIRVNPEVSELDYQNALTMQGFTIPAIRARSADTTIELGDGQSFVLAGLMYSSSANIEEKVPGLGSLPIIGDFFKRSQNSAEQQELVIVATPRLVSPMAAADVPKLPGEGLSYAPTPADMLLNTNRLETFADKYGLAK